jgi:hypothetical protein
MSKITNYNEVSKSYDTTREAADAHILKGMMENFTGKTVKVRLDLAAELNIALQTRNVVEINWPVDNLHNI